LYQSETKHDTDSKRTITNNDDDLNNSNNTIIGSNNIDSTNFIYTTAYNKNYTISNNSIDINNSIHYFIDDFKW